MENTKPSHFKKNWLSYLLLALLIIVSSTLFISKKRALSKQKTAMLTEQTAQQQFAQHALDSLNKDQLTVMTKALVWAVRSELVRDNSEQVDQYFRQFVKTKAVQDVTLINGIGLVELSTNKKIEGEILEADYKATALGTNDILIVENEKENLYIIAPVMSLNNRLGTLIVTYQRPMIAYK